VWSITVGMHTYGHTFSLLLVIQLNLTYKALIGARLSILLLRLEFCFLVSHIGLWLPHVLAGITLIRMPIYLDNSLLVNLLAE